MYIRINYTMSTSQSTSPTFSCFLPRIDTRSLPSMSGFDTADDYQDAVRTAISDVFSCSNLGTPTDIRLLKKYTDTGYLFFVAFVHFACTPSHSDTVAAAFRSRVLQGQTTLDLPGGSYWKVKRYASQPCSVLTHQDRLNLGALPPPLPLPTLTRQHAGPPGLPPADAPSSPEYDSEDDCNDHFASHLDNQLYTSAQAMFGNCGLLPPVAPLDIPFPPIGFAPWLERQSAAIRLGYSSALGAGDANLISQYHQQFLPGTAALSP